MTGYTLDLGGIQFLDGIGRQWFAKVVESFLQTLDLENERLGVDFSNLRQVSLDVVGGESGNE
jgi:hypothetical protein